MKIKAYLFLILNLLFFITSCSSPRPKGQTEAEILYREAKNLIKENQYLMAIEKLNKIQSEHPYSYYATPSEILRADIYFNQKNYQEAAASYKVFLELHPRYKKTPYILWKLAESYFKQLPPTYDRDLTAGESAIKFYKVLLNRFSKSPHASNAQKRIDSCKKMMKRKEKYIADFYFKTEVYSSARYRYLDILKQYNDSSLRNFSMFRVVKSSFLLEEYSLCLKYYENYRTLVSQEYKSKMDRIGRKCKALLKKS